MSNPKLLLKITAARFLLVNTWFLQLQYIRTPSICPRINPAHRPRPRLGSNAVVRYKVRLLHDTRRSRLAEAPHMMRIHVRVVRYNKHPCSMTSISPSAKTLAVAHRWSDVPQRAITFRSFSFSTHQPSSTACSGFQRARDLIVCSRMPLWLEFHCCLARHTIDLERCRWHVPLPCILLCGFAPRGAFTHVLRCRDRPKEDNPAS